MNRVLAQLSSAAFERLRPDLEPVALPLGKTIFEPGWAEDSLYFVSTGIASLLEVSSRVSVLARTSSAVTTSARRATGAAV